MRQPVIFSAAVIIGLFFTLPINFAAQAADRAQIMLVLDASGSMWGKVENKEKIVIARDVVGTILDDWDPETDLGVIAYGHRRKGDCDDIEMVLPVGAVNQDDVRRIVNQLQPQGKTPLSAAVLKAAEELRYSEERATVILVSDGKETCDMDPCAVGKELERVGVDFTAHVIGFDIAEDEREQLKCLAEITGGQYFDAKKADELKAALTTAVEQVKAEPEPEPAPPPVAEAELQAPETAPAGSSIEVTWEGPNSQGDYLSVASPEQKGRQQINYVYTSQGNPAPLLMPDEPGVFELRYVTRQDEPVLARRPITITAVEVSLKAADKAALGNTIAVEWVGPDSPRDYLSVATPDQPDNKHINYVYTSAGQPAQLQMPDAPGIYEIRYISGQSKTALARRPITIAAADVSLTAAEEAMMGNIIAVEWVGPDNPRDYLSVATPDQPDNKYINFVYTNAGQPAQLQMPDAPGVYEIRYISGQSKIALAHRPITITEVAVSVKAPAETAAGGIIPVDWVGPDNQRDYISVAAPDQPDNKYVNFVYTNAGQPAQLRMPDAPGVYEVRYISGQSRTALARQPIMITEVTASLNALNIVPANAAIRLEWVGPDNQRDYLSVATPDQPDNKYSAYVYTNQGNPASLKMPKEPGDYELRYIMGQSKTRLASRPITVVPEQAWAAQLADSPAGEVKLQAINADSQQPLTEGLKWTLYGVEGGDRSIKNSDDAQPSFTLPPGIYRANVTVGSVSKSLDFILNPGEQVVRTIPMNSQP